MTTTTAPTHAERLQAAATITAKARHEVDDHTALAAEVDRLKALAVGGELDDKGAAALLKKSESLRLGEITAPRRKKALDDALANEVAEALEVLADLQVTADAMLAEALGVADRLTGLLVDPLAADLRGDTGRGYERDTGRTILERYSRGTFRAAELVEKIATTSTKSWGTAHIPAAAAEIVAGFDDELVGIRAGIAALRAATGALEKNFA